MAKAKTRWTVRDFEDEVCRLDPEIKASDPAFKTAVLLLSALQEGININKLTKFTGYSKDFVRKKVTSGREGGIFVKGEVHDSGWFDKETGGVGFWLDVLCIEGKVQRRMGK
jgi:hypothetical protein